MWARTMGPLLETGVSLVHWMVWTYMLGSELRVEHIWRPWDTRTGRIKVSQVLAGLRMVIASSEASPQPAPGLLAVEISAVVTSISNYISHDHWEREAHMEFHHLRFAMRRRHMSYVCLRLARWLTVHLTTQSESYFHFVWWWPSRLFRWAALLSFFFTPRCISVS
jgi:hypothetical protein